MSELTEFLLRQKTDETESEIIAWAASEAIDGDLTPAQADAFMQHLQQSWLPQAVRASRAFRNLGWAVVSVVAPRLVRLEAQKCRGAEGWRDEWEV